MKREMQELTNHAHSLLCATKVLQPQLMNTSRLLVDELEVMVQQWLHRVYTCSSMETPSIPATISEEEVFKGVNLTVKSENGHERGSYSPSSPANQAQLNDEATYIQGQEVLSDPHIKLEESVTRRIPSGRPTKFPDMEIELCAWIAKCHRDGRNEHLTQYSIIRKAREIQLKLYPHEEFTGSKGWFERFGNRNPEYLRLTLKHGKPRYKIEEEKKTKKRRTRVRRADTYSEHMAMLQEREAEDIVLVSGVKEEAESPSVVRIDIDQEGNHFNERYEKVVYSAPSKSRKAQLQ